MTLVDFMERKAIHAGIRLYPFVVRQTNPITGAPIPQAQAGTAPPPPSVI